MALDFNRNNRNSPAISFIFPQISVLHSSLRAVKPIIASCKYRDTAGKSCKTTAITYLNGEIYVFEDFLFEPGAVILTDNDVCAMCIVWRPSKYDIDEHSFEAVLLTYHSVYRLIRAWSCVDGSLIEEMPFVYSQVVSVLTIHNRGLPIGKPTPLTTYVLVQSSECEIAVCESDGRTMVTFLDDISRQGAIRSVSANKSCIVAIVDFVGHVLVYDLNTLVSSSSVMPFFQEAKFSECTRASVSENTLCVITSMKIVLLRLERVSNRATYTVFNVVLAADVSLPWSFVLFDQNKAHDVYGVATSANASPSGEEISKIYDLNENELRSIDGWSKCIGSVDSWHVRIVDVLNGCGTNTILVEIGGTRIAACECDFLNNFNQAVITQYVCPSNKSNRVSLAALCESEGSHLFIARTEYTCDGAFKGSKSSPVITMCPLAIPECLGFDLEPIGGSDAKNIGVVTCMQGFVLDNRLLVGTSTGWLGTYIVGTSVCEKNRIQVDPWSLGIVRFLKLGNKDNRFSLFAVFEPNGVISVIQFVGTRLVKLARLRVVSSLTQNDFCSLHVTQETLNGNVLIKVWSSRRADKIADGSSCLATTHVHPVAESNSFVWRRESSSMQSMPWNVVRDDRIMNREILLIALSDCLSSDRDRRNTVLNLLQKQIIGSYVTGITSWSALSESYQIGSSVELRGTAKALHTIHRHMISVGRRFNEETISTSIGKESLTCLSLLLDLIELHDQPVDDDKTNALLVVSQLARFAMTVLARFIHETDSARARKWLREGESMTYLFCLAAAVCPKYIEESLNPHSRVPQILEQVRENKSLFLLFLFPHMYGALRRSAGGDSDTGLVSKVGDIMLNFISLLEHKHGTIKFYAQKCLAVIGYCNPVKFSKLLNSLIHQTYNSTIALHLIQQMSNTYNRHAIRYLPLLFENVILPCLDPMNNQLRKQSIGPTGDIFKYLNKNFPMTAFSQARQKFAIGATNGQIYVYDMRSGHKWRILDGHSGAISAIGFDPTGHHLASYCATDRTVRIWHITGGGIASAGPVVIRSSSNTDLRDNGSSTPFLSGLFGNATGGKCVLVEQLDELTESNRTTSPIRHPFDLNFRLNSVKVKWTSEHDVLLVRENGHGVQISI